MTAACNGVEHMQLIYKQYFCSTSFRIGFYSMSGPSR